MKDRIRRLFKKIANDIEIVLIKNSNEPHTDLSFFYFSGLRTGLFEGCIALLTNSDCEILTSPLEENSAIESGCNYSIYITPDKRNELLRERLRSVKKVGINSRDLTYENYLELRTILKGLNIKFVDVSTAIMQLRSIKDDDELKKLKVAGSIASNVADELPNYIQPGMTENELSAKINFLMQNYNAEAPSFTTIVATGKKSAIPHYVPTSRKIRNGDFVITDFGARYERYCSDITRTYVVGRASEKQKQIYEKTFEAQNVAFRKIRPGIKGMDIHLAVLDFINRSKFNGKFTHGTGHSIGLAVHDGFAINSHADFEIQENMVFTVEPGIYIHDYGGVRIEDDIVVTNNGFKFLTNAKKELIEV